ncbi:hypothetical protein TWF730_008930 [Orbilia blumenaviensis]|uniref:Uncharacterized protein n=1 Tax=Orbilia blumenaviensis TaxID=1796055 RepID=A0AAV9UY49_9PEZI
MNPSAEEFTVLGKADKAPAQIQADEATEFPGALAPQGNIIAHAASHTAEGMAEYLNLLEKIDSASEIAGKFAGYVNPVQITHREMGEFYGALETHIMPFLERYGYKDHHKTIMESYGALVDEISWFEMSEEGRKDVAMRYLEFTTALDRVLSSVIKDFGGGERAGEV